MGNHVAEEDDATGLHGARDEVCLRVHALSRKCSRGDVLLSLALHTKQCYMNYHFYLWLVYLCLIYLQLKDKLAFVKLSNIKHCTL